MFGCVCSLFVAFNLDFYTEVLDLSYLLEHLSDHLFFKKYKALNQALIGLIEDYSLVSFLPLSVQVSYSNQASCHSVLCSECASGLLFCPLSWVAVTFSGQ